MPRPSSTAHGTIVAVNRAWRMFTLDNDGDPSSTGVGVSYFEVCSRSAAAGCSDASAVAAGLHAVIAGDVVESELEYPCPSPAVGRWFMLRSTSIAGPEPGVLVSHANISRRKMAEQHLAREASEDPLTGLVNRATFTRRLDSALAPRSARPVRADVGLLYLDLDGFKPVNDTYGHAAGDQVLQAVAGRLSLLSRPEDTVARHGGDEFAMLTPRISREGLTGLVARIEEALSEPHLVHGKAIEVGASVGAHLATPGEDAAEALRRADEAMYAAKGVRRRV